MSHERAKKFFYQLYATQVHATKLVLLFFILEEVTTIEKRLVLIAIHVLYDRQVFYVVM